jgi:hypothetical protein
MDRVDCDGAFILFTTDNDKNKLNIHFDTSHQRHCIEAANKRAGLALRTFDRQS